MSKKSVGKVNIMYCYCNKGNITRLHAEILIDELRKLGISILRTFGCSERQKGFQLNLLEIMSMEDGNGINIHNEKLGV